jgi:hypothetical protein
LDIKYSAASDSPEITPEMVEAGARVLRGFSEDHETYGEGALEVYKAMESARLQLSEKSLGVY